VFSALLLSIDPQSPSFKCEMAASLPYLVISDNVTQIWPNGTSGRDESTRMYQLIFRYKMRLAQLVGVVPDDEHTWLDRRSR